MRRFTSFALPSFALLAALLAAPSDAQACGGCIYPEPSGPVDAGGPQVPSVVTDHRMALSLTPSMTTLWDQVQYAGDPAEFAWLLPVHGPVTVGVGSDNFLESLDQQTAPRIQPPTAVCDYGGGYGGYGEGDDVRTGCACGGMSAADEAAPGTTGGGPVDGGAEDDGVIITGRSTAGPYDVVQVRSDDPTAIFTWLKKNKYAVPDAIAPIITKYAAEKFDFVAVKLRPGAGVKSMRPIRVSWRGADPRLPLRMVAAGVGVRVGLKLFVIGDGRWRTQNFPTYSVDPGKLVWDFGVSRSNYSALREAGAKSFDDRAWALESSIDVASTSIPAPEPLIPIPDAGPDDTAPLDTGPVDTGASDTATPATDAPGADAFDATADGASDAGDDAVEGGADAGSDASPTADAPAPDTAAPPADTGAPTDVGTPPGVSPTATDTEIAFGTYTFRRVTRLRADLPVRHLSADLVLEADSNQAPLGVKNQATQWTNESTVCPGGTLRLAGAGAPATLLGKTDAACTLPSETSSKAAVPFGIGLGLAVMGLLRRRRR